ncbi:DUF1761 domain-containing protein [Neolewinella aurantiaca]|uniref:DUF1761 domain-containing protein n=1 Tax=Neolewinella aurantiaca TaxID=2602767 RepID=A0A5C7FFL3_9BACT|nr:DUF1761 domain-containing protein [Neolewinella aurantiaca]TXF89068.1 DUF1761 domain-containing protein [Neolewinella aurantiaca]
MKRKINWIAVAVAALAGMFIGFLWYGAFFNAQWSAGVGFTGPGLTEAGAEVFKHGEAVTLDPVTPMLFNLLVMVLYATFMAWLTGITGRTTLMGGLLLGAIVGGVLALNHVTTNMFAMNPSVLTVIDGSYCVALFAVMGAIAGAWRKK